MGNRVGRELDAARVIDPRLRAAYVRCRALHARHGRTYFLATQLLSPAQRPSVHALYGFARYADEIVDGMDEPASPTEQAARLDRLDAELRAALRDNRTNGRHPVLTAVADTAVRYRLDPALFEAFLASMRMDTHVTDYPSFDALHRYMYGSAAVIGLQMLPVLGTVVPPVEAEPAARTLGIAFQMTNFLRDVGEDLDRGRVYLPADELAAFGVDRELLQWCRTRHRSDRRVRRALAHLVARNRAMYRRAEPGIALLAPASRPCVRTAHTLYRGILDQIERVGYDVLDRRVAVPMRRRLAVALPALAHARFTGTVARRPSPGRGA
jgi:phytoene synthase